MVSPAWMASAGLRDGGKLTAHMSIVWDADIPLHVLVGGYS